MVKINTKYQSPNFADETIDPKYIVLHCMCFDDKTSLEFLCAEANGVSAHYFIARDGQIYNLVPDNKKAWHAGVSKWKNDEMLNTNSIGIELGNTGTLGNESGYTKQQYDSLIELLKDLQGRYKIKAENIIAHSDISCDRKTDPGARFNWSVLVENNLAVDFSKLSNTTDYISNLTDFGYNITYGEKNVIKAFQRRFLSDNISGELDNNTKQFIQDSKINRG
ncbi:MAG: N-acetylmuramoyl-L-alanine amidase AmiD [Proteobacteria bacterium]|nr:MAG: N-acetylmuramoyl-L-alanine amidase AmiD [Pseudomonadota bacterium]|tara:strand:+ start:781 stop:1446 length:666 start_codon:yes stop_codon:yes gene_type:complete